MSKKWIITGGAGFIGCHAAQKFLKRGDEVIVVDNLSRRGSDSNLAWLKQNGLKSFIQADIRDRTAIEEIIGNHKDADCVLHLAAQTAVTTSVVDPRTDFDINALGTFNVVDAVRTKAGGNPAVFYASTNKVYGALHHIKTTEQKNRHVLVGRDEGVDESEPLDFHSPYGCSKGAGDQYILDAARIFDMKTVAFRQSCIYGTRQFGVEDQGWIAWFSIATMTGKQFSIYGDGKQVRDALWVDDLTDLYARALDRIDRVKGEAFNVGGGPQNTLSLLELITWIEQKSGKKLDPPFAATRPGDQLIFIASTKKAEQLLGWRPTTSTKDGLEKLWGWIHENKALFA